MKRNERALRMKWYWFASLRIMMHSTWNWHGEVLILVYVEISVPLKFCAQLPGVCVVCVVCACYFVVFFFGVFKNWSTDLRFIRLCTSVDVEVLRAYVIPDLVVCRSKNGLNVVYCLWSYRLLSFFVDREKRTLKLLKGGNRTSEWRKRRRIRKRVCFGNIYEMAVF